MLFVLILIAIILLVGIGLVALAHWYPRVMAPVLVGLYGVLGLAEVIIGSEGPLRRAACVCEICGRAAWLFRCAPPGRDRKSRLSDPRLLCCLESAGAARLAGGPCQSAVLDHGRPSEPKTVLIARDAVLFPSGPVTLGSTRLS